MAKKNIAGRRVSQADLEARLSALGGSKLRWSPVTDPVSVNPLGPEDEGFIPGVSGAAQKVEAQRWVNDAGHEIVAAYDDGEWVIVKDEPADPKSTTRAPRPVNTTYQDDGTKTITYDDGTSSTEALSPGERRLQQEAKEREEERDRTAKRQEQLDKERNEQQAAQNRINQQQVTETGRHNQAMERGKPAPIGSASETEEFQMVFNPETGKVEGQKNPNYNAVKAQADTEQKRIATEIAQRRMSLDEGVEQYKQWFDTNVKVPFMQAEEARARATEQRQALDAEERRQQFAANFKLQKAELGQRAAATAISAEQSLLPYRAGPTEAAEMSSAINSLAAGGNPTGPSAAAGINFTPGAFQFAAPNFKKIASQAVEAAVGGLTDYRPSKQSYSTGDYSAPPISVPSYAYGGGGGGGGAPAYSAPSGGATNYSEYANPEDYQ